jgi:hypothetical protein
MCDIITNIMNVWKKSCPSCGKEQEYKLKKNFNKAIRLNRMCKECMYKSDIYIKKHKHNTSVMWNDKCKREYIIQKRKESINEWKKSSSITFNTQEYKEKQSKIQIEYLKLHPQKTINNIERFSKLREDENSVFNSPEYKEKLKNASINAWKNPTIRKKYNDALVKTKWIKVRTDKGQLELMDKWNKLGFRFQPNYQIKTDKDLFYIDGYDPIHNVVLEYDGKYHLKPSQQQKDLIRQNKIIDILHPKKFWRYNAMNKQYKNILEKVGTPDATSN